MIEQWTLFPTVLQRKFLLTLLAGIASAGISVIICVATKVSYPADIGDCRTLRLSYILSRDLGDCNT